MGLSVVSYIGGSFDGKNLVEDAARLTGGQIEKVCTKQDPYTHGIEPDATIGELIPGSGHSKLMTERQSTTKVQEDSSMELKSCTHGIEPDATIEELIVVAWVKEYCIGHPGEQIPVSGCPDQNYIRAQIASLKLEGYQEGVMYAFDHILRPLVYESSTRESVHLETIHKLTH